MKKIGLLIIAVITVISLISCGGASAPEGMQLCYGSDSEGYYFYVPEEWTLSNVGGIRSAYASRVDTSSISFAEVKIDESALGTLTGDEYFFTKYFQDSLAEFPTQPSITVNGESCSFGASENAAERAVKYVFTHEYDGHKFATMQILIKANGRYYIFSFNAANEERTEDETYYQFYLEKVQSCIDSFKFVEIKSTVSSPESFEKDADGYLLVSDRELCGFDFYTHPDFELDYASAIISVTHADGSNINMTRATSTGVVVSEYWKTRKSELSAIVGEISEIRANEEVTIGNCDRAFAYEYTYTYNGRQLHVYQVLAVKGFNGYVFTYTAVEENYSKHIDDVLNSSDKVVFK